LKKPEPGAGAGAQVRKVGAGSGLAPAFVDIFSNYICFFLYLYIIIEKNFVNRMTFLSKISLKPVEIKSYYCFSNIFLKKVEIFSEKNDI
jgi:hypothetical protein